MNGHKGVRIIIDSSTDISEHYLNRVEVIPMTVTIGDEIFLDGIDLTRNEFYERLETGEEPPKTSQPSPAAFGEVYADVLGRGQGCLVITLSSELSGTYESARLAAEIYPEVRVVDSKNVTIGAGILVEHAVECAEKGMGLDELVAEVEAMRERVRLLATLDTLEYLVRGGRISKAAGLAGGMLNIKPVVTIEDGTVRILGKARGPKKASNYLTEQIESRGVDYNKPILLAYSGTSDELLRNYIDTHESLWEGRMSELPCAQACGVIGTHAGPGAVAVAFFEA